MRPEIERQPMQKKGVNRDVKRHVAAPKVRAVTPRFKELTG
jgi:hypothetical protein